MSARPGPPPELVARFDQRRAELRNLVNKAVGRLRDHDERCRHDHCGMIALIYEILEELEDEPGGLVQAVELFVQASQMINETQRAREKEST